MVFGASREAVQDQFDIRGVKERWERTKGRLKARQGVSRLPSSSESGRRRRRGREGEGEREGYERQARKGDVIIAPPDRVQPDGFNWGLGPIMARR